MKAMIKCYDFVISFTGMNFSLDFEGILEREE
jgi:hypothetical protein